MQFEEMHYESQRQEFAFGVLAGVIAIRYYWVVDVLGRQSGKSSRVVISHSG